MLKRNKLTTDDILLIGTKSNNSCMKCKTKKGLEIHHVIPINNGGIDSSENMIILCKLCHRMIHKNKNDKELYNEEKTYKSFQSHSISSKHYFSQDIGWNMEIDSTDHFSFNCPRCKGEAIIEKVSLIDMTNLNVPPRLYIFLKCNHCKLKGQRKIYLNK